MNKIIRNSLVVLGLVMCMGIPAYSQEPGWDDGRSSQMSPDRFYLSFSLAEGSYFAYDYCDLCDSTLVAPFEFEVLFGFKLTKFLYLDLAVNWAIDYWEYYGHDAVSYLVGVRPGARLVLPLLFHRFLYFRAAVPLHYSLETEKERLIAGFLFGIGYEIQFGKMGIFGEVDITPYFVEVYEDYMVIPVHGRVGLSLRF